VENKNNSTRMWIAVIVAVVSLTFGIVKTVDAASLGNRVNEIEKEVGKIDVILEKIDNIEEDVAKIESRMRERDDD